MHRRLHLWLASLLLLALWLPACAGRGGGARGGDITLGVVTASAADPFDARMLAGARAKAQELGVKLSEHDPAGDVSRQVALLEQLVGQRPQGIIVRALDPDAVVGALQKALEAGIPTITVGLLTNTDVTSHVGFDEYRAGQVAGEWVARRLADQGGGVAILTGPADSLTYDRVTGFQDALSQAQGVQVVAVEEAGSDRAAAAEVAARLLREHPDLAAIFAETDALALGAADAVSRAGAKALVAGVGYSPDALAAVEAGQLALLVVLDGRPAGAVAVESAVRKAKGEEIELFLEVDPVAVTRENVKDFTGGQ